MGPHNDQCLISTRLVNDVDKPDENVPLTAGYLCTGVAKSARMNHSVALLATVRCVKKLEVRATAIKCGRAV